MANVVGFDRKIELAWLDAIADRAAQVENVAELRSYAHDLLKSKHPGDIARGKSVTVLLRIWYFVPDEFAGVKHEAIQLLAKVNSRQRIWLHWGMCMLAYPLFRDTAETIGRLFKLQDHVTAGQIERRLFAQWGERTTVRRALQRVIRSMVEWEVIRDNGTKGTFEKKDATLKSNEEVQLWLLKACHLAVPGESLELSQLLTHPALFPFELTVGRANLRRSPSFDIHRQGLDMDIVNITSG